MYYLGGDQGGRTNVYRYDGTNWTEVASLPESMVSVTASAWDGKLYAIGGFGDGLPLTAVYAYDGSGWTAAALLPKKITAAVKMICTNLYANRGEQVIGQTVSEDKTAERLLASYRLWEEFE